MEFYEIVANISKKSIRRLNIYLNIQGLYKPGTFLHASLPDRHLIIIEPACSSLCNHNNQPKRYNNISMHWLYSIINYEGPKDDDPSQHKQTSLFIWQRLKNQETILIEHNW